MIAVPRGYDSMREYLDDCDYYTAEIREKYHSNGCVHRYKGAEGTILVGEHYER
mgnify:CR=1 FL=1